MVAQHTPGLGNCELTFEKFQKVGEASLEHHWNNYEHCGSWCQAKSWIAAEKIEFKKKNRYKELNPKEYEQQTRVKEKFLEPARIGYTTSGETTKPNKSTVWSSTSSCGNGLISAVQSVEGQEQTWLLVSIHWDIWTTTDNFSLTLDFR
jgi:hypothetical protein